LIPLWLRSLFAASFFRFAVIGASAFIVEAGAFALFQALLGDAAILSRILSFPVAYSVNWYLNRVWGFAEGRKRPAARQFGVYGVIQLIGVAINLALFVLLLRSAALFRDFPILALVFASLVVMVFNYLAARRFAFAAPQDERGRMS
jgi:putative flippase GtrA